MAPPKRFTAEEIQERRRLREKERREKRRNDPDLREEDRLKEKINYLKKKLKRQIKPAFELSTSELRRKRKKWYEDLPTEEDDANSPTSNTPPSQENPISRPVSIKREIIEESRREEEATTQIPDSDESTIFGKMVAEKLRKLTPLNRAVAQNHIQNYLFQLEMEELGRARPPSCQVQVKHESDTEDYSTQEWT